MCDEHQDRLYDATIAFDNSAEALADYIEGGGELDLALRKRVASLLRKYGPKHRGGKDPRRDIEFYEFVRDWCLFQPFQLLSDKLQKKTSRLPEPEEIFEHFGKLGKHLSTEDGLKHVIETGAFGVSPNAEIGGLRKRYDRGKALVSGQK